MKITVINRILYVVLGALALMTSIASCKKETDLGEAPRLFRPTVKGNLISTGNYIEASWQTIKGAASYTLQISRDTFKTIDRTLEVDTSTALLEDLLWDQLYQLQVRANAADSTRDSKFGLLGDVKTPKFPSILEPATVNDATDNSVIMRWIPSGDPVTEIKLYSDSDRMLIKSIPLTVTDTANHYKIVENLKSETAYYLELYSGTKLRGYNTYITKAPFAGEVVDLRGVANRPSVLEDTLPTVPSGSTIILKKGFTYTLDEGIGLSKTITITSGSALLIQEPANIFITSNFDFEEGSVIDSISFVNVALTGSDASSKYVLNGSRSATVGKIKFENCEMAFFRGLMRLKGGTIEISNLEINNCIVDSIGGYGLLTVDKSSCSVKNISLTNSTIYKAEKIITSSKQASESVLIANCTINEAPRSGNYLVDYGSQSVSSGIRVLNNIFGIAKDKSGDVKGKGIRANASIDASNNYATADFVDGGDAVPNLIFYSRPSSELFEDPSVGDFKILDMGFPGRNDTGDPRWRP